MNKFNFRGDLALKLEAPDLIGLKRINRQINGHITNLLSLVIEIEYAKKKVNKLEPKTNTYKIMLELSLHLNLNKFISAEIMRIAIAQL